MFGKGHRVVLWQKSQKRNIQSYQSSSVNVDNPLLPIKVSCDASQKGLGVVLEQKENEHWHPIAYASHPLNKSEQNHCN